MTRWICLLALLGLPFACGDGDRPPELPGGSADGGALSFGGRPQTSAGESGEGGGTGTDGGAPSQVGGQGGSAGSETAGAGGEPPIALGEPPIVELTSPEAVSNPNGDRPVLHGDNVTATCRVRRSTAPGSALVDPSSVTIETFDRDGAPLSSEKPVNGEQNAVDNSYSATFALGQYPIGRVSFVCTATDVKQRQGSARVESFIDHGPKITPVAPGVNANLPFKGEQVFEFKVEPEPIVDADPGSAVGEVELHVGSAVFPLTPVPNEPNTYRKSVNFDAENIPAGTVRVDIVAKNKRKPEAARANSGYNVKVDDEGPTIKVVRPADNSIVGNVLELVFTVEDDLSGVDQESIIVKVNSSDEATFQYVPGDSRWSLTAEGFTLVVDRSEIDGSIAKPYIQLFASDKVGNTAEQSFHVYIDDKAPIIDLSPPPLQTRIPIANDVYCSDAPFDVLGDAVRDQANVSSAAASVFRAAVWDLTNHAQGQIEDQYAGIQQGSVALYLQKDLQVPLFVVDGPTKVGKACTRLDTQGTAYIRLDALAVGGRPRYEHDCSSPATTREQTAHFCNDLSDLTFVPKHAYNEEQVLYGVEPNASVACTGDSVELSSMLRNHTGWVCLGAQVSDNAGNVGISQPLRVCIQDAKDPKPCPAPVPSCTDGCSVPALRFDFSEPELGASGYLSYRKY